jgi:hypothetical protein
VPAASLPIPPNGECEEHHEEYEPGFDKAMHRRILVHARAKNEKNKANSDV